MTKMFVDTDTGFVLKFPHKKAFVCVTLGNQEKPERFEASILCEVNPNLNTLRIL